MIHNLWINFTFERKTIETHKVAFKIIFTFNKIMCNTAFHFTNISISHKDFSFIMFGFRISLARNNSKNWTCMVWPRGMLGVDQCKIRQELLFIHLSFLSSWYTSQMEAERGRQIHLFLQSHLDRRTWGKTPSPTWWGLHRSTHTETQAARGSGAGDHWVLALHTAGTWRGTNTWV